MNPTLVPATMADYAVMQNMSRFYVYEMSRYCGFLPGWECPKDGLYECFDFKKYFEAPDTYPFLIKDGEELVGFVVVDKKGVTPDIDWNMAQFFVMAKFQKQGLGKRFTHQVFDEFKGLWAVNVIPENLGALQFWRKTVGAYTQGNFQEAMETIHEQAPAEDHEDLVLTFRSTP
jgi:predicted acetyltransferase